MGSGFSNFLSQGFCSVVPQQAQTGAAMLYQVELGVHWSPPPSSGTALGPVPRSLQQFVGTPEASLVPLPSICTGTLVMLISVQSRMSSLPPICTISKASISNMD